MKQKIAALLAALLAAGLVACGNKETPNSYPVEVETPKQTSAPVSQSASQPQSAPEKKPGWVTAPRQDLEIVESLADKAPSETVPGEWHRTMALFQQDGKTGLISQKGEIIVPASEDVHWCPVCGVTNADESKIFDGEGKEVGSGGHGQDNTMPLYDAQKDVLYMPSDADLVSWENVYVASPDSFMAQIVTLTPTEDEVNGYRLESGELVEVSEPTGYMLFQPDGSRLVDTVFEEIRPRKEDVFAARKDGLWGFVHAITGQEMLPFQYQQVLPSHQGLAAVDTGEGWAYVSIGGVQKTSASFQKATTAQDSVAWVKTEEGWGVAALEEWPAE